MVPEIDEGGLEVKVQSLVDGESLGQLHVLEELSWRMEVGMLTESSRRDVRRDVTGVGTAPRGAHQVLRIDQSGIRLAWNLVNADGMLQLTRSNTVQLNAAVSDVIEGIEATGKHRWRTRLPG